MMIVAATTSTGMVSLIIFGFPLIYRTIPRPINIKRAVAAATLSIQPGYG